VNFTVTASDNCPGVTVVSTPASGSVFPKGTTTVKSVATDAAGNKDSCSFTVKVNDTEAPKIACPANVVTLVDSAACSAVVNFVATVTDNCPGATVTCTPPSGTAFTKGTTTVNCTATDASFNTASCSFTVTVNNPAPAVTITGPASGSIVAAGVPVNFTGTFTDNKGTHSALWIFDATTKVGTVNEGTGAVTATYTFANAGVYTVRLTVKDQCGDSGTATQVGGFGAMVVIYDPNAGFVTGGGWITSPPGAYTASPSFIGKANFGFVSKYKKGQSTPTGETEFQFQVANFNFHSTSYDWLVIAGAKAQYKGSGTINNAGDYGFILTGIDGDVNGGGGIDKFRIKVYNKTTNAIVYDNQLGAADSSAPTTALGGGSIVIHPNGGSAVTAHASGSETTENAGMPTTYALEQNYPNPFNPTTRIQYALPVNSVVRLSIYNILGQTVATLIDGEIQSSGFKEVEFDATSLPSGLYFYHLSARSIDGSETPGASFNEVKKMVLMR